MQGIRWAEKDKFGNEIYLTEERWEHITNQMNHSEMLEYEVELRETIQSGNRKQEILSPNKFRYSKKFDDLTSENTHIIGIVVMNFSESENEELISNNFIVTAYQKKVW
jgi:hypothetical protein